MSDLISVIVAAYNEENNICNCIGSIKNQTYHDTEVIIVDDGSSDSTALVSDSYANADHRVLSIHQRNSGVSAARNIGLELCNGSYITFIDSDDEYDIDIISYAVNKAHNTNSDIVTWGYQAVFYNKNRTITNKFDRKYECSLSDLSEKSLNEVWDCVGLLGYCWNKLYHREVIIGCHFPTSIPLYEDMIFNSKALEQANRIVFESKIGTFYNNYIRNSQGSKYYDDYLQYALEANNAIVMILTRIGCQLKDRMLLSDSFLIDVVKTAIQMIARNSMSREDKFVKMKELVDNQTVQQIVRTKHIEKLRKKAMLYFVRRKYVGLLCPIGKI